MESFQQTLLMMQHLMETWNEISTQILRHPEKILDYHKANFETYFQQWEKMTNDTGFFEDKRFQYKEWQTNVLFNFIERFYLVLSHYIQNLIEKIAPEDPHIANKLRFYAKQWMDASSPTNFVNMNPEVIAKIVDTQGENLISGLNQFMEDMKKSDGFLKMTMTDMDAFELGKNIACTKGAVIYQNELMQLIQYEHTTKKVYSMPILIIPPWINKYYILDLSPQNSLVKWLVDQGFQVFIISWVNPTSAHRHLTFSDYLFQGAKAAIKIIKKITHKEKIHTLGYCIGGTLLGCLLGYYAQKKSSPIQTATFLTTLFDFKEPGDLGVFIDEKQLALMEKSMKKEGYFAGSLMFTIFNTLRANDLIWATFVNNYLKAEKLKSFDLLYWNADSTNIPEKVHRFYLRKMYLQNLLIQPNKIKIRDIALDLSLVKTPSYFLAAIEDHIVPWKSSFMSQKYINGPKKFVLAHSGHVAGIVNPPDKNKYGFYVHPDNIKTPEDFLQSATFITGSWWNDWLQWIVPYAGEAVPFESLKQEKIAHIEDAPGSYVKKRL